MKKKTRSTKFPTSANTGAMHVRVHSDQSPHILSAVCKGANLEEAKDVSRKLWAVAVKPYVAYITDDDGKELFLFKG